MHSRFSGAIKSTLPAALLALAGLSAATPASAQLAGLYVGTTSQGKTIEITVTQDDSGLYYFGGALVFWDATCKTTGPGRSVGWGIGNTGVPFSYPNFEYEFMGNSLYEKYRMRFIGGTRIRGNFLGRTPEFVDSSASSKKVQLCDSGPVDFTADYAPPAAQAAAASAMRLPAAGQAVQVR